MMQQPAPLLRLVLEHLDNLRNVLIRLTHSSRHDTHGVCQHLASELLHALFEGGAEEKRLAVGPDLAQHAADLRVRV